MGFYKKCALYAVPAVALLCIDLIRNIYKTTAMISPIIAPPDSCIFMSKYKIQKVEGEELAGVTLGRPREADDIQVLLPLPAVYRVS
jgi:hypothetical protein